MKTNSKRVAYALSRLDRTQRYRHADTLEAVFLYQLIAAARHGHHEPFGEDASELNAWLTRVQAGKALVDDAWDAFAAYDAADNAAPDKGTAARKASH